MWRTGVALFGALAGFAAQPDYFPLQVGNQWSYRPSRLGPAFTVEVVDTATASGQSYFVVQGFLTGTIWLRMSDDGTLYAYDPDEKMEAVWASFGAGVGQTYSTAIDPCNSTATIRSLAAPVDVPIGHFENALAISYSASTCSNSGLISEYYLPYTGLLQRTYNSTAGPLVYDLVYARLNNGLTIITAPEQSFTSTLDQTVYATGALATARITIRNTQAQPVSLRFPTLQRYDVLVRNAAGDTVYRWSSGRVFGQLASTLQLTGEKTWMVQFAMPSAAGSYTVETSLATDTQAWRVLMPVTVK